MQRLTGFYKRSAALLVTLAVMITGLSAPTRSASADNGGVQFVRVLLSTEGASKLTIPVTGTYTLKETGRTFTGGTLTVSASGSNVTVRHSAEGELYSGGSATVERSALSRSAGSMRFAVVSGNRSFLGHFTFSARDGAVRVVNRVPLSHYLYGVVGHEMSNEFPLEALKAQAVAAKGYVLLHLSSSGSYDIGDTASDQVYRGYNPEDTNVISAVDATIGDVLYYNGKPLLCYYAASNGGWMILPGTRWSDKSEDGAYNAGADPYDMANPSTPRETVLLPTSYSQRTMGTPAFTFIDTRMFNAIGQSVRFPENFLYGGVRSIDSVTSSGDAGSASDKNHTTVTVNATVVANLDARFIPTPTPMWDPTPSPTPAWDPTPSPTPAWDGSIANNPPAAADNQPGALDTPPPIKPAQQLDDPAIDAGATPKPPLAADAPTGDAAGEVTPTPSPTPEWEPTPSPTPAWEPTPSPTPMPELTKELPVSFSFTFAEMAAAGLFTSSSLRIYYAEATADGFSLLHARYGHGVGMSQRGAQQMAYQGMSYRAILNFYYPGAQMGTMGYVSPESVPAAGQTEAVTIASTGTILHGTVNLRKSPSTNATSLEKLPEGTQLTLLGMDGEWYCVTAPSGNTGYVRYDYVLLTGSSMIAAGVISASSVNYRTGPDTSYSSISQLSRDTVVGIYGMENGWYKIMPLTTGAPGFVKKEYVSITKNLADNPVPGTGPAPTAVPPTLPPGATPTPIAVGPTPAPDGGIVPAPTATPIPVYAASGFVNASGVNLRKGASTATASYGRLPKNTQLGIYEKIGAWYRVCTLNGKQDGFMYGKYITLHTTQTESTTDPSISGQVATVTKGYVNASGVRIRTGPGTGYDSLGTLSRSTTVTILSSSGSWVLVEVRSSGTKGFIFSKYVTVTGLTKPDTATGVISARLNLRTAPTTTGSQVLTVMPKGAVVTVHSTTNGWCLVTYEGTQGYCLSSCVRFQG